MDESNLSTCRACGKIEVRQQDGFYPDGRNKRYVDGAGKLWCGRTCSVCHKTKVKVQIKTKRTKVKNEEV